MIQAHARRLYAPRHTRTHADHTQQTLAHYRNYFLSVLARESPACRPIEQRAQAGCPADTPPTVHGNREELMLARVRLSVRLETFKRPSSIVRAVSYGTTIYIDIQLIQNTTIMAPCRRVWITSPNVARKLFSVKNLVGMQIFGGSYHRRPCRPRSERQTYVLN